MSCQTPLIAPQMTPLSEASLTSVVSYSAQEGLAEAQNLASQWAKDAHLFEISSPWVEQGGLSSAWSYHFYSIQAASQYTVKQGSGLSSAWLESPPTPLSNSRDWLDSAQITSFTRVQAFVFPLLSMRLTGDGIWQIETPYQSLSIDGYSGQIRCLCVSTSHSLLF